MARYAEQCRDVGDGAREVSRLCRERRVVGRLLEVVHQVTDDPTYKTLRTHVPPVLAIKDGELVVRLMFGNDTYEAGVHDGRFFFSQVVDKLIDPALLKAFPRKDP